MNKIVENIIALIFMALLVAQVAVVSQADFGSIAPSEYHDTPLTVVIGGREY